MTIPLWQIDAFCSKPFSGNPAAVCILDELITYQASPRGGELKPRVTDERVFLTGQAVTVFKGVLHA